jgi:hypothetical protein
MMEKLRMRAGFVIRSVSLAGRVDRREARQGYGTVTPGDGWAARHTSRATLGACDASSLY